MTDPAKPYQCNVCDKAFPKPSDLKRHEVVHTGEKPFECDDCGSKFSVKSNLYVHNRRKHASQSPKSNHNTPRNVGHKAGKSAKAVLDKSRTVSTPNTGRKRSKTAPPKRSRQEEEDLEAISDDNDRSEQQREIDSESVVASNRETGNHGNSDEVNNQIESNEDRTEEKPLLMLAPLPKRSKIDTPLIKSTPFRIKLENPIVQEVGDLMPLLDLSTSSLAPQQGVFDMDLDSEIGSVSNHSSINSPQFSFDEDIRQIAHQLSRVATARPNDHDALREVMFGTVLAFDSGGFNGNVGEFYKKLSDRYNN